MLSLAPDLHARVGHRFTAVGGPFEECEGCPLQKMCFSVEAGRHYEIQALRDVVHPCNLHEGGMRVVEVDEAPFESALETKRLRGTAASFVPVDCGNPECANWNLCHPVGPQRDVRYGIEAIGDDVDCPMDYKLKRVRLRRV